MNDLASYLIAAAVSLAPLPESGPVAFPGPPLPIEADCSRPQALEQAIARAAKQGGADIRVIGTCVGNYLIESDGITLRGAFPGAGLIAADPDRPVVEIADANAAVRNLTIRGGVAGLFVHGTHGETLLVDVELSDHEVGAFADAGAQMRLLDSKVSDGLVGVDFRDANGSLTRVIVSGHELGVSMLSEGRIGLTDCTIRDNSGAGLNVSNRGDVVLFGTRFENNGEVHANANDYSSIRLLSGTTLGAPGDTTLFALGSNRRSTVSVFSTPEIFGNVSVLNRGSLDIGQATLHGDIYVDLFADAAIRNVTVEGIVACDDRGEAICSGVTSLANLGCAAECGDAPATARQRGALDYAPPTVRRPDPAR